MGLFREEGAGARILTPSVVVRSKDVTDALSFPVGSFSGCALRYGGSGPHAVKQKVAELLHLPKATVADRWPFFRPGCPTTISADEMHSFFTAEGQV